MEFARKFVLVPADRDQEFADDHLSNLDNQIQDILKMKMDDDEKAKMYIQDLQKFVTFPNVNLSKPIEKQSLEENTVDKIDVEKNVTDSVPVKYTNIAKKIMNFLKDHQITWTPSLELVVNNNVIDGSNLEHLINFLLRNKSQRPAVFDRFQELLTIINFPKNFIKNKYLTPVKTMYAKPNPKRKKNLSPIKWLKM